MTSDSSAVRRSASCWQSVMSLDRVANGRWSNVVAVTGEAGAAARRDSVSEASSTASRAARSTIFAGVCAPYGESNVWAPIATALFRRLDGL